jgi:cold shock protein
LVTGRVLQFDPARGYGFVAADDGGEDIFLHASAFDGDPGAIVPGVRIKVQVVASDRGRKASTAQLVTGQPATAPAPAEEEQMCDVLSGEEFSRELTERLLKNVPGLTGQQILQARESMLELARKHGWSDS